MQIDGLQVLKLKLVRDGRGIFKKLPNLDSMTVPQQIGPWVEQFYSVSKEGVMRGMHFQMPPFEQDKLVTCLTGKALDVVIDLRAGDNYGTIFSHLLKYDEPDSIFIPRGCAHGFLSLEGNTTIHYLTTSRHSVEHDRGILWSSVEFDWGILDPIVSVRDSEFPSMAEFNSPF